MKKGKEIAWKPEKKMQLIGKNRFSPIKIKRGRSRFPCILGQLL